MYSMHKKSIVERWNRDHFCHSYGPISVDRFYTYLNDHWKAYSVNKYYYYRETININKCAIYVYDSNKPTGTNKRRWRRSEMSNDWPKFNIRHNRQFGRQFDRFWKRDAF